MCDISVSFMLLKLQSPVQLIATVQQTQPTIQLLLSTSDFVGAIDLITTTQDVLQHELRGVHSLRCGCCFCSLS